MKAMTIGGVTFWKDVDAEIKRTRGVAHFNDGDLEYVAMTVHASTSIIRRTAEEFFATTVKREVANQDYRVAINGCFYDVSYMGMVDIGAGHDPVDASETQPIGHVVSDGVHVTGRASMAFFLSYEPTQPIVDSYSFGGPTVQTPGSSKAGLGGLNPLVIGGLPYGVTNAYKSGVPAGAPVSGPPGATYAPFLIQRSNAGFKKATSFSPRSGTIAFAVSEKHARILVLVQPNAARTGIGVEDLRDKLLAVGIENAVLLDGSDSVLLTVDGAARIQQGEDKDESCTIGLGFKYDSKIYIFKGGQYMRYSVGKDLAERGPHAVAGNWPGMPAAFSAKIDAALRWPNDNIYMFSGSQYVRYNPWLDKVDQGPKEIAAGWKKMPSDFAKGIDSAVTWSSTRAYLTRGDQYVRYDITSDEVDRGPLPIKGNWKGLPTSFESGFDSMTDYGNGKVYITKGSKYVAYSKADDRVEGGIESISADWHGVGGFSSGFDSMIAYGPLVMI